MDLIATPVSIELKSTSDFIIFNYAVVIVVIFVVLLRLTMVVRQEDGSVLVAQGYHRWRLVKE